MKWNILQAFLESKTKTFFENPEENIFATDSK